MNWLKLAPYIGFLIVLGGLGAWHLSKVRAADRAGYARAMEEVRKERDTERALYEHKREVAERDYQSKVSELETRVSNLVARPGPAIRLCKPAADQVRSPETARSTDGAASGARPDLRVGDDISGPALVLAAQCEHDRVTLKQLQAWIRSLD
jgi:hypothetical protein